MDVDEAYAARRVLATKKDKLAKLSWLEKKWPNKVGRVEHDEEERRRVQPPLRLQLLLQVMEENAHDLLRQIRGNSIKSIAKRFKHHNHERDDSEADEEGGSVKQ